MLVSIQLPAGFEILNPSLAGYGTFSGAARGGVHLYTYTVRATTPGRFAAPPSTAEEMYHPETFGRGAGAVVE